jgi:hypothetical protein
VYKNKFGIPPLYIFFYFYYWCGGTKSLGTAATSGLLYKPQMIDEGDCGAIGGMKIGRGNRSIRRKPAPVPLCPPQIPHDQVRARTPDRRSGKPATNRLSYGAAALIYLLKRPFLLDWKLIMTAGQGLARRRPRPIRKCYPTIRL